MIISKKSRYALRAVYELSKRKDEGPIKIGEIAKRQSIPQRFLEAILLELKQAGLVESRRGSEGGYSLSGEPEGISVYDVLRVVQGLPEPVECVGTPDAECPMSLNCVFIPMWKKMMGAITDIYESTTFGHLLAEERNIRGSASLDYSI